MATHYDWRHGWIPITERAALIKAHGSHQLADKLLRRGEAWHALDDERLADALGDATDDATIDRIVAELDRRDAADRKAERARASRARSREARDAKRSAAYDAAIDAGEDPEESYARIYGVSEEKLRREQAIDVMRSNGYRGKGLTELCRDAFKEHAELSYLAAEDYCRGHMLNRAGQAAKVSYRSLFTGPESRARKYASEDLLRYWQENGRMTLEDFTGSVLGGHQLRRAGTAAWA